MDAIGIAFVIGFSDGAIGEKFSHQNMRLPPPPPRPHTLSVFTVKNVNPCTTRRACIVVDSLLRLAVNRPISARALTASGLLLRN